MVFVFAIVNSKQQYGECIYNNICSPMSVNSLQYGEIDLQIDVVQLITICI